MPARQTARKVLMLCQTRGAWSDAVLREQIEAAGLDRKDAALCTTLCCGVLQNRALLDYYIRRVSHGSEAFAARPSGYPAAGGLSDHHAGSCAGCRCGERGGEAGESPVFSAGSRALQRRPSEYAAEQGQADPAQGLCHSLQPSRRAGGSDESISGQASGRDFRGGQQSGGNLRPGKHPENRCRHPERPFGSPGGRGNASSLGTGLLPDSRRGRDCPAACLSGGADAGAGSGGAAGRWM